MARTQTLVQLTDELIELLDARASRQGVSRSQVVREAVEAHLRRSEAIGRAIVEGAIPASRPECPTSGATLRHGTTRWPKPERVKDGLTSGECSAVSRPGLVDRIPVARPPVLWPS
ncbi:MAG: ribbon-helix-helix protein, CopG family [Egibacteraceae bacterium]